MFFSLLSYLLWSLLVAAAALGNTTNTHRAQYTFFVHPYYVTSSYIRVRPPSVRSCIASSLFSLFCLLILHCLQRIYNSFFPRAFWMHRDAATRAAAWASAHRVFKTLVKQERTNQVFVWLLWMWRVVGGGKVKRKDGGGPPNSPFFEQVLPWNMTNFFRAAFVSRSFFSYYASHSQSRGPWITPRINLPTAQQPSS